MQNSTVPIKCKAHCAILIYDYTSFLNAFLLVVEGLIGNKDRELKDFKMI